MRIRSSSTSWRKWSSLPGHTLSQADPCDQVLDLTANRFLLLARINIVSRCAMHRRSPGWVNNRTGRFTICWLIGAR
jgi:hypothetical protein